MPPVSTDVRNAILAGAKEVLGPDFRVRLIDPDPCDVNLPDVALIALVRYQGFSQRKDITRAFLHDMTLSPELFGKYIGRESRENLIDA